MAALISNNQMLKPQGPMKLGINNFYKDFSVIVMLRIKAHACTSVKKV